MSGYNKLLSILLDATVPNIEAIAANIGRAFDPDVGGDKSFTAETEYQSLPDIDGERTTVTANVLTTASVCTAEFAEQAKYLLNHADNLYSAVQHDYVVRWADLAPPTREECEVFINSILVFEATP